MNVIQTKLQRKLVGSLLASFVLFVTILPLGAAENGILKGVVSDISEKPVTGCQVFVYTSSDVKRSTDYLSKATESDGRYQVILPTGTYWVVGRLRTDGARFGPLSPRDKHSGDPVQIEMTAGGEIDLDLVVADLREATQIRSKERDDYMKVEGRIVTPNGLPVPMVYVVGSTRSQTIDIPKYISGWSDKDGRFSLYLPHGQFYLGTATLFPPSKNMSLTRMIDTGVDGNIQEELLFTVSSPVPE